MTAPDQPPAEIDPFQQRLLEAMQKSQRRRARRERFTAFRKSRGFKAALIAAAFAINAAGVPPSWSLGKQEGAEMKNSAAGQKTIDGVAVGFGIFPARAFGEASATAYQLCALWDIGNKKLCGEAALPNGVKDPSPLRVVGLFASGTLGVGYLTAKHIIQLPATVAAGATGYWYGSAKPSDAVLPKLG